MKFEVSAIAVDGRLESYWDALLRVVCDFSIVVRGRPWYEEKNFCVLELADSLASWLDQSGENAEDFLYVSLESAEPELFRFAYLADGTWRLRSPHENYREDGALSTAEIRGAAQDFLRELWLRLPDKSAVLALLAGHNPDAPLLRPGRLRPVDLEQS